MRRNKTNRKAQVLREATKVGKRSFSYEKNLMPPPADLVDFDAIFILSQYKTASGEVKTKTIQKTQKNVEIGEAFLNCLQGFFEEMGELYRIRLEYAIQYMADEISEKNWGES